MRASAGIFLATFFLVGCGKSTVLENTERDLAGCRLEVAKILPAEIAHPSDSFNQLLDSCMKTKGHRPNFSATKWRCDAERSEECYSTP
jgi:hypothetical protein